MKINHLITTLLIGLASCFFQNIYSDSIDTEKTKFKVEVCDDSCEVYQNLSSHNNRETIILLIVLSCAVYYFFNTKSGHAGSIGESSIKATKALVENNIVLDNIINNTQHESSFLLEPTLEEDHQIKSVQQSIAPPTQEENINTNNQQPNESSIKVTKALVENNIVLDNIINNTQHESSFLLEPTLEEDHQIKSEQQSIAPPTQEENINTNNQQPNESSIKATKALVENNIVLDNIINNTQHESSFLLEPTLEEDHQIKSEQQSIASRNNINTNNQQHNENNIETKVSENNPSTGSSICKKLTLFSCLIAALLIIVDGEFCINCKSSFFECRDKSSFFECKEGFKELVSLELDGKESPEKENEHLSKCKYMYEFEKNGVGVIETLKIKKKQAIREKKEYKNNKQAYSQDCYDYVQQCCYLWQAEQSLSTSSDIRLSHYYDFYGKMEPKYLEEIKVERSQKTAPANKIFNGWKKTLKKEYKELMEECPEYKFIKEYMTFRGDRYTSTAISYNWNRKYADPEYYKATWTLEEIYKGVDIYGFPTYYNYRPASSYTELISRYVGIYNLAIQLKSIIIHTAIVEEGQRSFFLMNEYYSDYSEYLRFICKTPIKENFVFRVYKKYASLLNQYKSALYDVETELILYEIELLSALLKEIEKDKIYNYVLVSIEDLVKSLLKLEIQIETEVTQPLEKKLFQKNRLNGLRIKIGELTSEVVRKISGKNNIKTNIEEYKSLNRDSLIKFKNFEEKVHYYDKTLEFVRVI